MSELSQLSPQPLWAILPGFAPSRTVLSRRTARRAHYGLGKEKGLHAERDQVGNILIRKGATAGSGKPRKPVALQAHLDMVPQKNKRHRPRLR